MKEILLIEDDPNIKKLIEYNLQNAGYKFYSSSTGENGLEILEKNKIDLIILDIMLPGMDGFEICKIIKSNNKLKNIPIIILTAKGEEIDRVVGLELGADDYVVKPFSPRELILRIKSVLKRVSIPLDTKTELLFGDLIVNIEAYQVFINKTEIKLTSKEFKLLVTLLQNKGKVLERDFLLETIWEISPEVTTRTVDTHIKKLRQKLLDYGKYIETIRSVGYRFKAEII